MMRTQELCGEPIEFIDNCIGKKAIDSIRMPSKNGRIVMFENLRFHPEEESNDPLFASALADGFDIYVNEAFGASHRCHASICGVPKVMAICLGGINLMSELSHFQTLVNDPVRPFAAVVGGAKVSTKIAVLMRLLDRVDVLLVGGAMVFTFLRAQGVCVGARQASLHPPMRSPSSLQLPPLIARREVIVRTGSGRRG